MIGRVFFGCIAGRRLILILALALWPLATSVSGGIAIVDTVLSDNGDNDGFADTRETVSMRLSVQNTSGELLTGVSLSIHTADPQLVCPTQSSVSIGDLSPGELRLTDAFEFVVTDIDRTGLGLGPYDALSAIFEIVAQSDPAHEAVPSRITLDLDLDVAPGEISPDFVESFEGSMGAFEPENLDQSLHGLQAADGWRCQYHDPDWPNSNCYNNPPYADICYPGATQAHADEIWWGLSGPGISVSDSGRAFTGQHSLYFGRDLGPPDKWTSPVSSIEAVKTTEPIPLDANASPVLSFKHQISIDVNPCSECESSNRAVVMAQLADEAGNPAGDWIKLDGFQNPYGSDPDWNIFNCSFDPADDGTTEDDFFEPWDAGRKFGPSSTCSPEKVFARAGDTSQPFAPGNVNRADGPGLGGEWGIGTWVETRFDLGRFKGRQIRIRFLATSIKLNDTDETWADWASQWDDLDDGWWIDDVTVSGVLEEPPAVVVDSKDNSQLPGLPDGEGDGVADLCDNCEDASNTDQADWDYDGDGNICDPCVLDPLNDIDADGYCADGDNCPSEWNPDQSDVDDDTFGDVCDTCPDYADPLQIDGDGDGWGLFCDCTDSDPLTYPGAPEVNDGKDNQCLDDHGFGLIDELSGTIGFQDPEDKNILSWPAQQGATAYQVGRANVATFWIGCRTFPTVDPHLIDPDEPASGELRYYLVRPTEPNAGSWGARSSGTHRVVPCQ